MANGQSAEAAAVVPIEAVRTWDLNCNIEIPQSCGVVIFGASGDLTKRKILPSLYHLSLDKLLPAGFFVMGTARTRWSDEEFRREMREAVKTAVPSEFSEESWAAFAQRLYYSSIEYTDTSTYRILMERLVPPEKKYGTIGNRIFVLAVPPEVFETVILNLGEAGLSKEKGCYSHVVIEKPIGRDLASARRLNAVLSAHFEENQIYRMDHYLAKETVQNILMFRFANSIFEPLWNRRYIDHIEITVAEKIGIEHRAGYYEQSGVIRDMFQNHLFQLLALTAMEPPALFTSDRVHDEKAKVFRSVRPFNLHKLDESIVIGQYGRGMIDGKEVPAYREEPGVVPDSTIPTYAAMKVFIDNWRWQSVPFYLRSGKRLPVRRAEIEIHFRPVPHFMFSSTLQQESIDANKLVFRIQPNDGIGLSMQAKRPGTRICLDTVQMDFPYQSPLMLDDYERVSLDSMQGDQMLFARGDAVEVTWELLTPVIEKLERETRKEAFPNYAAGTEGPEAAAKLLERDGRTWRAL